MRIIAHRINKQQHQRETTSSLRAALLPIGDLSAGLMAEMRTAIMNRNPVAGRFTREAGTQPALEQRLNTYLTNITDETFVALTRDATEMLVTRMREEPAATGGYVVFAHHEHDGAEYLLVVLLSTKAQPSFDEHLNLVASITLDFEHLRHAGRVKLNELPANTDGVVHFVSRRAQETSDYFRDFLGCEALTDSAAQGNLLHTALRSLAATNQLETGDATALMERAYSYWQTCRHEKRTMTLTALANVLAPQNPTIVLQHLSSEHHGLAGEFAPPPPSIMRRFVKFAFSKRGLRLEFDRDDWLEKVSVTRGNSVVIRDAPAELIQDINDAKT